ncbi:hydroxymethylglutaryl-CoA lyase [Neptunitalea lumnitzerae]|uniref:Hydroxymethylglutaryl-CoA lyase n=1 Tax=Neptunitalea lumnitzerae TaxID=2965509 RepID=A0ABQ5MNK1_9FLAO|nr:hydroxymethylglutaryl-CoA lyase [Neptunitalea sp. Y10]GLB50949.1 hydroxymethylglutaryl-CoA lyase [Neptunitalea sp. Y10]
MEKVQLIECPRDAMQGIKEFIPTENKIQYIQALLRVGFDTIDIGSFVSPKAIPQMADTATVIKALNLTTTNSKLLTIVANVRGAVEACSMDEITYLGFPFSISEIFQMRNTHKTISESLKTLEEISSLAYKNDKKIVTYLSMGFGNPYGDPWDVDIVANWTDRLHEMGITILSLSDTIGVAKPDTISYLFSNLIKAYPQIDFGAHLHTSKLTWFEKVNAAFESGCRRFDGAIQGYGGCPMAKDELIGNMPTEKLVSYFTSKKVDANMSAMSFESAYNEASKIFKKYR